MCHSGENQNPLLLLDLLLKYTKRLFRMGLIYYYYELSAMSCEL